VLIFTWGEITMADIIPMNKEARSATPIEITFTDPIFFHKSQIKIDTRLRYYGRMAPNTEWRVVKIVTFSQRKGAAVRRKHIDHVEHLSDDITLLKTGTNEVRVITFSYMSYSAIWRLA
jgi:hypothetical protein